VRILIDECVDWRLSRDVIGHDVKTARQMGWATIKNGELLALAAQQTNRLADLRPLIPALLAALHSSRPGIAQVIASG